MRFISYFGARNRRLVGLFSTAALVAFSLPASANIVGSDFQSFNPTSDGLDFVTVQSARTLAPGVFTVGGFLDEAFNTLPPAYDVNGHRFTAQDQILSSDLHAALGLTQGWEIGINFLSALNENVNSDQLKSYFVKSGVTDLRVSTKIHLTGEKASGLSVNLLADIPQIQNDPFYGGGTALAYAGEVIYEMQFDRLLWSINAGVDLRNPGSQVPSAPYQPVGKEWIASTGLDYHFEHSNWSAIGELYAAQPFSGTQYNSISDLTALEALVGAKYIGVKNLTMHFGGTAEILRGTSSPDFRIYVGLNWYPWRFWGGKDPEPAKPAEPAPIKEDLLPAPTPAPEPTSTPAPTPTLPVTPVSSSATNLSVFDKDPQAQTERFIVREINFESGSAVVPETFMPYLQKLAEYTKRGRPLKQLQISGHTDSQGSATYNQGLSQRRAQAVKEVLVSHFAMDGAKIEPIGMGLTSPIATNETAEGRSRNRRVEFKIDRE